MPLSVLDVFSDANVRDYYRELTPEPQLGELFFPNAEKIPELEIKYIVGANNQPVIANIHAMDSETEIGARDGFKTRTLELLKIARKLQLKESDIRKLNQPRNNSEQEYVAKALYDDVTNTRNSVRTRIEAMRMQALADGELIINGNGISKASIDYLVPAANKYNVSKLPGAKAWSDPNADILGDIFMMTEKLLQNGGSYVRRALTSRKILMYMLTNSSIRKAYFGVNSDMLMTLPRLNELFLSQGLPQVATYDAYYREAKSSTNSYNNIRFFPEDKFVMTPETALGETIYGITAEELYKTSDVEYSETDNILTMVYTTGVDPVGVWTKSCAIAIPSFPEAGNVIQAKVI